MGLPFLKFTVMRLALFLVALVAVYWVSHSVLAALVLGAVISALLSYVLLRGPRDELAQALQTKVSNRLAEPAGPASAAARRRAEDDAVEDAAADAEIARQEAARRAAAEASAQGEPRAEQ